MRTRLLVPTLMAVLASAPALGVDVYKWTDEKGVVHFGDRRSAPGGGGEKVPIREAAPASPSAPAAPAAKRPGLPGQLPEPSITPMGEVERSGGFAGQPVAQIKQCAAYARTASDLQESPQRKPMYQLIQQRCPGVGFKCVTINGQPEKNRCDPFAHDGKGTFFIDERKGFPVRMPELGRPDIKPMQPMPAPMPAPRPVPQV